MWKAFKTFVWIGMFAIVGLAISIPFFAHADILGVPIKIPVPPSSGCGG